MIYIVVLILGIPILSGVALAIAQQYDKQQVYVETQTQPAYFDDYTQSFIDGGYMIIGYDMYKDGVLLFTGKENNNGVDVKMFNNGYKTVGTVMPSNFFKFVFDYENGLL